MNPLIRISRNSVRLLSCATVLLAIASGAVAQSFNIDLDLITGPPEVGNGAPSELFGAAANQTGAWNRVYCLSPGPDRLIDVHGLTTGVFMSATNTGSGGGSGSTINTGDYAFLLNDYARVPNNMSYVFSGLIPGSYRVYTYVVNPSSTSQGPVNVRIDGSNEGNELISGTSTGNTFTYLVTHSVHEIPALSSDLVINLSGPWPNAYVNGFQIVSVPEPATITILFLAAAGLLRKKKA